MISCPKCNGSKFYYVQRVYEYHTVESIAGNGRLGGVNLSCLDNSVVDSMFTYVFYCEDCDQHMDYIMKDGKINWSDIDEEAVYENS